MATILPPNALLLNLEADWVEWLSRTLPLKSGDVVFRVAGHTWAASAPEAVWVQKAGARLVEGPSDDPDAWASLCVSHRVSVACLWASSLAQLLNVAKQTELSSLRAVICGGEALLADVARSLLRHTRAELIHFHAPQFFPPIFCGRVREESLLADHVSAGWVYGPWKVELLDDHGRPVPRGVVGHIILRSTEGGEALRIGERGRLLRDGSIMMAVELNHAGWIRGHYIDASTVNSMILNMSEICDCHVALRRIAGFGAALLAWVVPKSNIFGDQIRAAIKRQLSPIFQPTAVIPITALPLTNQGDVDVASLEDLPAWQLGSEQQLQRRLMGYEGVEDAVAFLLPESFPATNEAEQEIWRDGLQVCKLDEPEPPNSENLTDTESFGKLVASEQLPLCDGCLLEYLMRTVENQPYQCIRFVHPDGVVTELSYYELLQTSSRVLRGLRREGLKAGDFIILQLINQQQFIIGFWACVLGGLVPVPVSVPAKYSDNNSAVRRLINTWRMLGSARILTDVMRGNDVDRLLRQEGHNVTVTLCIEQLLANEEDRDWHLASPDDLALLLLTSGSTGTPKAVMHSHRTLLSRCEATRLHRGYTERDISLNWLPLDHVGAIVMFHLRDVVLGCEQIHVDTDYVLTDPLRWLDLVHDTRATVTWAPNFAYALINGLSDIVKHRSWDLSCLRILINAGEVVVPRTARRFIELLKSKGLPDDAMKPEWGMSETSSAVTGSKEFLLADTRDDDHFVALGAPLPGVELRVVGDRVAGGEGFPHVGRLQVRGPMVTLGYYGNVEETNEAFVADGWFDTGDLACFKNGQLAIVGRHKDSIIVNGTNFLAHEIEAVVDELPGVLRSFTVAIAYRSPNSDTDSVVVFFVPEDRVSVPELLESIRHYVGLTFRLQLAYVVPVLAHEIPKTTIGKLQRTELRARFEQGEFANRLRQIDGAELRTKLHQQSATICWRRISSTRPTFPSSSLFSVCATNFLLADSVADVLRASGVQAKALTKEQVFSEWGGDTLIYLGALEYECLPSPDRAEHLLLECSDIVKAIAASSTGGNCRRFVIVTRQAVGVLPDEAIDCAGAALGAWVKSAMQELPGVLYRQIDIATIGDGIAALVDELLCDEIEPIVARRNGYRYMPRLQRLSTSALADFAGASLLQHGSLYLLVGGLGGVGMAVARRLVQELGARLLLVGRRQRDEFVDAQLREASLPAQAVLYASCDICNAPEVLRTVVAQAEAHFGQPLAGVFYLAAESGLAERWVQLGRQGVLCGTIKEQIRINLQAKTIGVHNLVDQLADRSGIPFIAFSSVTASFGAPGLAEYAAANAYLSAFCAEQRRMGHRQTYALEWSIWEATGLARQIPAAAYERLAQQGYAAWSSNRSLDAMMEYLQEPMVQPLLLGITDAHPDWRRRGAMPWRAAECLRGYFAGEPVGVAALSKLSLRDGLGRMKFCELVHLPTLPRDANGGVNKQWLCGQLGLRIRGSAPFVGPRTSSERHLAAIWQSLLNIGEVSVYDNFFEVGGHSLLATQVVSRLRSELGVELPLRQIFETPTLEVQAQCIERLLEHGRQSQIPRAIRRAVSAAQLQEVSK